MGVVYASIDVESYTLKNDGTCILSGWRASEDVGEIQLELLADDTVGIPYKIKFSLREDVFEICPGLNKADRKIGFKLSFCQLDQLLQKYNSFKLYGVQGSDRTILWEKTRETMTEAYGKGTLIRRLDNVKKIGDKMIFSGWVIDALREDILKVEDEHGKVIEAKCRRIVRPDVIESYHLEDGYACGFEITVCRKELQGNKICIRVKNSLAEKVTVIDLKKFDYENSPRGRMMRTISPRRRKENLKIIREHGFPYFVRFVKEQMQGDLQDYEVWRKAHQISPKDLKKQQAYKFSWNPKMSIAIPLYNTPIPYLKELLQSIVNQTYANWELCLADGSTDLKVGTYIKEHYGKEKRIKYCKLKENLGIAGNTNAAVEMATGEYVMLCDHDDLVAPDALFEMAKALNKDHTIDILYTDEDLVNSDTTEFSSPRFKPDFNFDFLRSINYICHIFMVRKSILDEVGCFREEYDGAQDYDFILRCCEKTEKIHHIPKILYHWRAHENSTAGNPQSKEYAIQAGKKALEEHYRRMGMDAEVQYTGIFIMFRTILKVQGNPKVSIVIPTKDHIEDLDKCLVSIEEKSTWKNYEIIVVENNSEEPETFAYYEEIQKKYPNIKVVTWNGPFNYSAINNFGFQYASGDYYILLNNDIEVITPEWMEIMIGYCQREDVGIVGAKLYYPDDTVQHAGVVIGVGGFAGHILTQMERKDVGYFGRLQAVQDISAVTAACLMIKKTVFDAVHGLDEEFEVALNDVDLCLKVRKLGKQVVFHPGVEMYHYESKSRGSESSPKKHERFKKEIARFRNKWSEILEKGDPYYNENLTLMYGDCRFRGKDEHFDIIEEIEGGK